MLALGEGVLGVELIPRGRELAASWRSLELDVASCGGFGGQTMFVGCDAGEDEEGELQDSDEVGARMLAEAMTN